MYVPCQVAGDSNAKYLGLDYSLSVYSVDMYGWEVCPYFIKINNTLFCLNAVDFRVILDWMAASSRFGAWESDPVYMMHVSSTYL